MKQFSDTVFYLQYPIFKTQKDALFQKLQASARGIRVGNPWKNAGENAGKRLDTGKNKGG